MNQFFWRLLTSERLNIPGPYALDDWTLDDCLDAHMQLDALDEARRQAAKG